MKRGRQMAWAMIVRTAVFDEIIEAQIRAGADQIVNLAAGLDTRPWRMKLPADLRWVDVDLPGILDYKLETMRGETPVCRYEGIRADLREAAVREELFARLGAQSRRTLVVTEGLLIYLTPDQVGALAADLHRPPSFHSWLIDLARPELLAMMQRMWGKSQGNVNAPFLFAPDENTKILRAVRLARGGVPLVDGGGPSPGSRDVDDVALAPARAAPFATGAGEVQTVFGDRPVRSNLRNSPN